MRWLPSHDLRTGENARSAGRLMQINRSEMDCLKEDLAQPT
jgi:hypothetical protein